MVLNPHKSMNMSKYALLPPWFEAVYSNIFTNSTDNKCIIEQKQECIHSGTIIKLYCHLVQGLIKH